MNISSVDKASRPLHNVGACSLVSEWTSASISLYLTQSEIFEAIQG